MTIQHLPRHLILVSILLSADCALGVNHMEIRASYTVPYPVAQVYAAWVSSDTVIPPATTMDVDPKVGGHYRLLMQGEDFSMRNEGTFIEVRPGEFVHYTWEWNGDGEVSHIEVTFTPQGQETQIDIYHHSFTKPESVASHATGWDNYIEGFNAHLKKQTP